MTRKPENKNPADQNAGMMTMATIDVGAHSARLLIAEVDCRTFEFTPLEERLMLRSGDSSLAGRQKQAAVIVAILFLALFIVAAIVVKN